MAGNDFFVERNEDLVNNPTARVPVCLCLDTSGSMDGSPINELNDGIRMFYDAIKDDEVAMYSAEICIVTFGGNVECIRDFSSLSIEPEPPTLYANSNTPMGEAVTMALDLLERRKEEYREKGVDYYQPWLVLMTDGYPDSNSSASNAARRAAELVNSKKLTVFPIGIGEGADMDVLAEFSPKRRPLRLQGLKFKEFFEWLSKSVSRVSQSTPGDEIKLDTDTISDWATL